MGTSSRAHIPAIMGANRAMPNFDQWKLIAGGALALADRRKYRKVVWGPRPWRSAVPREPEGVAHYSANCGVSSQSGIDLPVARQPPAPEQGIHIGRDHKPVSPKRLF